MCSLMLKNIEDHASEFAHAVCFIQNPARYDDGFWQVEEKGRCKPAIGPPERCATTGCSVSSFHSVKNIGKQNQPYGNYFSNVFYPLLNTSVPMFDYFSEYRWLVQVIIKRYIWNNNIKFFEKFILPGI